MLAIERGRYNKTAFENRIFPLCHKMVEDEFHYIMTCTELNKPKIKMFNEICNIVPCFNSITNENKFDFIFSCEECDHILNIIVNSISEMYNQRNNYNVNT